jgi:hypothetical protein
MWWPGAPAGEAARGGPPPPAGAPAPGGESLPTLAGGSPELDAAALPEEVPQEPRAFRVLGAQPEVALVAMLGGLAIIFFGIIPQPLFELVRGAGGALGLM